MSIETKWQKCSTRVFWSEVAPCNHIVQIYENDDVFIHTLSAFVQEGFKLGDCIIIMATPEHLIELYDSLVNDNIDMILFVENGQYIVINVEDATAKFMVADSPDEILFNKFINDTLKVPHQQKMQIRAFGEIVSELLKKGNIDATIRLENLWNELCKSESFCLFCAYPKSSFKDNEIGPLESICATHSKIINGVNKNKKEIEFASIKSMHQSNLMPN